VTDNSREKRHNTKTETESLPGAPAALRAPTTPPRIDSSEDKQVGLQRREWLKRLRKAGAFWIGLSSLLAHVAYTVVSRNQWREQIRATGEATKAAETAQRQLEMSERPWLKVAFTVQKPGITFTNGGMQLNIVPHIENISHSVATGVVSPMEIFRADDSNTMFKEPLKRQKHLCDNLAKTPVLHGQESTGVVIFPNDSDSSWGYGLGLSKAEVDAAKDGRIGVKGANMVGPKLLVPIVYGCVDYVYETSDRHHQTQFIFELQQVNRTSTVPARIPMVAIRANQLVKESDVVIEKYPFGGFYAY